MNAFPVLLDEFVELVESTRGGEDVWNTVLAGL